MSPRAHHGIDAGAAVAVASAGVTLAFAALTLAAAVTPAFAQKSVNIGTNPPGTALYAVGSGLAKVATEAGAVKMTVQPYSGSSTFLPLLDSGELEFGVNNAVDMALAVRGPSFKIGGRNPFPHTPNARLVMNGSPFLVGLLVVEWSIAPATAVARRPSPSLEE